MSTALSHSLLMPMPSEFQKPKQGIAFEMNATLSRTGRGPEPSGAERLNPLYSLIFLTLSQPPRPPGTKVVSHSQAQKLPASTLLV